MTAQPPASNFTRDLFFDPDTPCDIVQSFSILFLVEYIMSV
jgi:hypothetical protein